ncbi:MAG: hypothetical protein ACM3ST_10570 [Bdellovibrio bacteriovorus]
MIGALDFAYPQARVQARYAALPTETEWQRLAGARTLGAYLEDARVGPMRPWVKGFSALSGAHDVERGLRALAWEQVQEVAAWVPGAWRPSVAWIAWLPFLAVLEQLARTAPLPRWLAQDPRLAELLDDDGVASADALERRGLTVLVSEGDAEQVLSRWVNAWQSRLPTLRRGTTRQLELFSRDLRAHLAVFRRSSPDAAWGLRQTLRERLRLRFHQHPLQPLTVFLYLALILLDLERLRGELVRRCVYSPGAPGGEPA